MKRIAKLLLPAVMALLMPVIVQAQDLPFTLSKPVTTSVTLANADSPTTMNYAFTKSRDMSAFLALKGADEGTAMKNEYLSKIAAKGLSDVSVQLQLDWALDDPKDWKYTDATKVYWDNGGVDDKGSRLGEWNMITLGLQEPLVQQEWITRSLIPDDSDSAWAGVEGGIPGLKDQLKAGQYSTNSDGYITIDYSAHTLYVRSRYQVSYTRTDDTTGYEYSDWSDVASYGKNGRTIPKYDTATLPVPEVSNLHLTDQRSNGEPVAAYSLAFTDAMFQTLSDLSVKNGSFYIDVEMRAKGTKEWTHMSNADRDIKNSDFLVSLFLAPEGYMIPDGSTLEFRARYYCDQAGDPAPTYSAYSPILEMKTTQIGTGKKSIYESADNTPEPLSEGDENVALEEKEELIKSANTDKGDVKGATNRYLLLQAKEGNKSVKLKWKKITGADGYVIYGAPCGKKMEYLTTIENGSTTGYTQSGLKKGVYYKYIVTAYRNTDSGKRAITTSFSAHCVTKGGKKGNPLKLKVEKAKLNVKPGKKVKIKGSITSKLPVNKHIAVLRFESDNDKVATVDKKGNVKGISKGKATIYVYAQNGLYKKVKITVK